MERLVKVVKYSTEKVFVHMKNKKKIYTYFFYKQLVYKQLVLGWQIAKQLSRFNPFSLSNNKKCRLKKSGPFPV